ncbi:MAG: fused MFS/spermidine synthase [Micromonosporaceae bacterium]
MDAVPHATRPPLPPALAAALVFAASGAVLVLEVVGLRLVGPYLGITLQTSSAVIATALAAIAYGAWTGGWLADRIDPRRLLAPTLLLAAGATALTLPLVRWAGELLRGAAVAGVLLLAGVAIFVPAALLAAVTPLVVKLQLGDVGHTGRVVGRLSSIGTLGAITATLGTGFILVAALPTSIVLLGLAGALAAGGVALAVYLARLGVGGASSGLLGRPRAMLAVVGLAGAGLTALAPNPCTVETAYHCARVVADPARPSGRLLVLNSARHSYVDLADPAHLEFAYTQWIGAFLDGYAPAGRPLTVLHVGGGGFTLPGYLAATRPGTVSRVLELDGDLVALDRARLGLRTGPRLQVRIGDARIGVAGEVSGRYDVVIGDAFGHLVVPWHLTTREFIAEIRRVLRPDGVYALNVIDYPPDRFARAEVATVAAVFPYVALVAPPDGLAGHRGANFVLFASMAPLRLDDLAIRLSALAEPPGLVSGAELAAFAAGAGVLTDDYAPVDQMLTGP